MPTFTLELHTCKRCQALLLCAHWEMRSQVLIPRPRAFYPLSLLPGLLEFSQNELPLLSFVCFCCFSSVVRVWSQPFVVAVTKVHGDFIFKGLLYFYLMCMSALPPMYVGEPHGHSACRGPKRTSGQNWS